MAFDISTAKPEQQSGGFDLSTAQPQVNANALPSGGRPSGGNVQAQPSDQAVGRGADSGGAISGGLDVLGNAALELVAGVNRGALSVADIPANIANAVFELTGTDIRVPSVGEIPVPFSGGEAVASGAAGGFVESPVGRQIAGTAGEFLSPGLPIKAIAGTAVGANAADDLVKAFSTQSKAKQEIAKRLTEDPSSKKLVQYIADGAGRVQKDKVALTAIKQGFDKGTVAAIKGATKQDRAKMAAMTDIMKKGRDNAVFAAKNRPADIAGQSLADRVNHIKRANRAAGKGVDQAARALRGQAVDVSPAVNRLMSDLKDMGVRVTRSNGGRIRPVFDGSDIEGLKGPQRAVAQLIKRLSDTKAPDAHDAHRMKRFIDEQVTYGSAGEGLKGATERILKSFRRELDGTLDASFPGYKSQNDTYSSTISALDSFQDAAGTKVNLFGGNANKAIGAASRRLLSNTQSRVNMFDAIDELESVAAKTGKKFDDDVLTQVLYADELDSVFAPVARSSLAGEVKKSVRSASEGQRGLTEKIVDTIGEAAEGAFGKGDDDKFKAINELLKREN